MVSDTVILFGIGATTQIITTLTYNVHKTKPTGLEHGIFAGILFSVSKFIMENKLIPQLK